jgi:hypothetical protein
VQRPSPPRRTNPRTFPKTFCAEAGILRSTRLGSAWLKYSLSLTAFGIGGPAHLRAAERVAPRAAWRGQRLHLALVACVFCDVLYVHAALAQLAPYESVLMPDSGKLPLTAGFNDVDGVGGAGLVPWALITGYGTADSWGANAHYTAVQLRDFHLRSYGVAVGALDRVELSAADDKFDATGTALNGLSVSQHIFGLKVRVYGDAVYDQDSWVPQTAVGVEYKKNTGISNGGAAGLPALVSPTQLGARSDTGTDWYLSATKVYLAQSLLVNAVLRYTKANEFGLLGFGGDLDHNRSVEFETTIAYILTRKFAVGAEYRDKPHNLSVDDEQGAWDVFAAWTASRNISIVGAYVSLGSILAPVTGQSRHQNGAYLSLQVGF